jgi:hypothetical protein
MIIFDMSFDCVDVGVFRVELYEAHMQRAAALQADRQAFREQEAADLIKEKRDQDRMQV